MGQHIVYKSATIKIITMQYYTGWDIVGYCAALKRIVVVHINGSLGFFGPVGQYPPSAEYVLDPKPPTNNQTEQIG